MSDSDVVIGKKRTTAKVAKTSSQINAALRQGSATKKNPYVKFNKAHQGTDPQRIAKLDRENEVAPPSKVSLGVGHAMESARMKRELTQKQVAQRVNEKEAVIKDYESGKAIPSPQILAKLERYLNVKLRGADIGKELKPSKPTTEAELKKNESAHKPA